MKFHNLIKYIFYTCIVWGSYWTHTKPNNIIEKINIETSNKKLKTKLEKHLTQYKDDSYSTSMNNLIRQNITQYLLKNNYRNSLLKGPLIYSKKNKKTLSFKIEHPYQYQFLIKGNKQIKHFRLIQALQPKTLFHQTSFIRTAIHQMTSYYHSNGFNNAEIKFKTFRDKKNYTYTIICTVDEGYKFYIKRISITGSFSKKKIYYRQLFFSNASPILQSRIYVPKDFGLALKKLTASLRRTGFLNAKIYHKNIIKKKQNIFIEIFLNEGPPLIVKSINIQGNTVFSDKEIQQILDIQKNSALNLENWSKGIQNLIQSYQDKGFFSAYISNPSRILDIEKSLQTAHINIQIKEEKQAFIHDIQVKGNKKVKSSFIIHASGLTKGTYIRGKDIQTAQDLINDLEIFSSVHVAPMISKSKKTIIVIEVAERNFRFFRVLFGSNIRNNKFSIHLPIEYIEKRFLNSDNSELILNTRLGSNFQLLRYSLDRLFLPQQTYNDLFSKVLDRKFFEYDFSIKYKKYYFWNTRWSTQLSYSQSDNIFSFPEEESKETQIKQQEIYFKGVQWKKTDTFTLSLERKFDLSTIFNIKLFELEWIESRTVKNNAPPSEENYKILSLTGLSFLIDHRNDIFYPTSGQMLSSSLEYSPPLNTDSSIHFLKTESKYYFYLPVFSSGIIWAQSLSGGYAHRFGSAGIPVTHFFILGGVNSLRGFDGDINGERVPNRYELEITDANDIIKESVFYFLTQSELRFPLYKDILKGVIFYDGSYMKLTKTQQKKPYRHTVGFGFHYGLLALTLGVKLNPFESINKESGEITKEGSFKINFQVGVF